MSSAQLMQIWRLHKEAILWLLGCRLEQKSVRFVDGFPRDLRYWAKFLKKGITNRRGDWRKFKRHHVQIVYGLMEGQEMGKLSGNCCSMKKTVFPNMHAGNCCSKTTRAKVSEVKKNAVVLILQGHDGILCYITTWVHEFVPMKRSDESSSPYFLFFRWKPAHVVSFRDTACLWDNPKNLGSTRYSQVWTVEERSINFGYCSAQRISGTNRVSRMVRTILAICLSETFASENREYVQKIFHPKQCWFQTQRQQWTKNVRTL